MLNINPCIIFSKNFIFYETKPAFGKSYNMNDINTERRTKMKKQLSKLIMYALTVAILMLPAAAYAATGGGETGQPMTIDSCNITFSEKSATKANAKVSATSRNADYIISKITLQSAPAGSSSYTNVSSADPSVKTVYNTNSIHHICDFPITQNKNYRIKVELSDNVNGKKSSNTYYKNLTRH